MVSFANSRAFSNLVASGCPRLLSFCAHARSCGFGLLNMTVLTCLESAPWQSNTSTMLASAAASLARAKVKEVIATNPNLPLAPITVPPASHPLRATAAGEPPDRSGKWSATPARDSEGRDWVWRHYKVVERFESILKGYVESGKMERFKVEQSTKDKAIRWFKRA